MAGFFGSKGSFALSRHNLADLRRAMPELRKFRFAALDSSDAPVEFLARDRYDPEFDFAPVGVQHHPYVHAYWYFADQQWVELDSGFVPDTELDSEGYASYETLLRYIPKGSPLVHALMVYNYRECRQRLPAAHTPSATYTIYRTL